MTTERPGDRRVEDLLQRLAPRVLGALVRRHGQFDACEDAVQEALLAGALRWPDEGVPDNPQGWLLTVASRRLIDQIRSESARREREQRVVAATPAAELLAPAPDERADDGTDDTLALLFLCCHPVLTAPSQIALTLRAVGGLSTAEIARAFLVPEATMAQRISRAKQRIRDAGATFAMPGPEDRPERLKAVLHVLYLVFNEGYGTSAGSSLQRLDLTAEAIRLTRQLRTLAPLDGEVQGLLALMLLTDARRATRTDDQGNLVPLAEQDRSRWNAEQIDEGVALVTHALTTTRLGPYQVQAAVAAVHAEAPSAEKTDWPQILALYETLERLAPNPVVTLNRAVALAEVHGPRAGLDLLAALEQQSAALADHHMLHAVRGHLLEAVGEPVAAREAYRAAARRTRSLPEQRYLDARARRLL
ncbi:RNA polymerase sigma factor [Streptacidiphilus sp. EB103A]|uniref:RNA polymerase sigma factor n=1 Tax=Streptacidiphilus sp. EB103A TaxID=3156275 RepID=UPI0035125496